MVWSLAFDPLVPLWALVAGGVIAVLLTAFSGFLNLRGWLLRTLTMALLLLALANPAFEREDREPLSSVVAHVVDNSQSQPHTPPPATTHHAGVQKTPPIGAPDGF
ncbi:MAG: hypothetical protein VYA18_17220, partial [Pseudomonadota bacterium]|nr:hypothetical protein [Pseudomonadota bacterium]